MKCHEDRFSSHPRPRWSGRDDDPPRDIECDMCGHWFERNDVTEMMHGWLCDECFAKNERLPSDYEDWRDYDNARRARELR